MIRKIKSEPREPRRLRFRLSVELIFYFYPRIFRPCILKLPTSIEHISCSEQAVSATKLTNYSNHDGHQEDER